MATQTFRGVLNNRTCPICNAQQASHFCNCVKPPALFCLHCCGQHNFKSPRVIHKAIPIAALDKVPKEYKRKSKTLMMAAVELRRNVELVDQYSSELDGLMQNCINYLTEYRTWGLQRLQTMKEELHAIIETAIQENTDCLDQGLEPVSPLAQAMWTLPPEELQVFSYSVNVPDMQTLCQSWTHCQNSLKSLCERFPEKHEVVSNPAADLFAVVWNNTLQMYDLNTQQSILHTLPVDFGEGGSYIALDQHTLLCLGGVPVSRNAYELDLPSFEITSLQSLCTARANAGVACTSHSVYVFGGDDPDNLSYEEYELHGQQWVLLGNMKYPRGCFTPCTYRDLIYLPCPRTTAVLETFSPETNSFAELLVSFPPGMLSGYDSVAFVANGELCVLTGGKQLGRWKIETENEFRLYDTDRACWSTQPPLILDSFILIASEGRVEMFSLEFYSFI